MSSSWRVSSHYPRVYLLRLREIASRVSIAYSRIPTIFLHFNVQSCSRVHPLSYRMLFGASLPSNIWSLFQPSRMKVYSGLTRRLLLQILPLLFNIYLFLLLIRRKFSTGYIHLWGTRLVEALCYKPEGRRLSLTYFIDLNPSDRKMALGSIQPVTEISSRNISWLVKAAGAYGWQPYHIHVPAVLKSGSLLGTTGSIQACNGIVYIFILLNRIITV